MLKFRLIGISLFIIFTEKQNLMSNKEVIAELKGQLKIYTHVTMPNGKLMSPSYFSQMCSKIEVDLCHSKTIKKFFGKFGYVGEWNNFEKKA